MSFWPKRSYGSLQTTQALAKTIGCSPQTDSETPLLKTTSSQLIEHGEDRPVPTYSFHPVCTRRHSACHWRRNQTSQKTLTYNSACKICWCSGGTALVGATGHCLIWLKAHSSRWSPDLRLDGIGTQGKTKYDCSLKNIAKKWPLMTFCYPHRLVPCSALVRETPLAADGNKQTSSQTSYSEWETLKHSVLMGCSLQIPPLWAHGTLQKSLKVSSVWILWLPV